MPAGFRHHLVAKTLRNAATVMSLCWQFNDHPDFFYKPTEFYLNSTINLRHLTQCIMPSYMHKMAIVS